MGFNLDAYLTESNHEGVDHSGLPGVGDGTGIFDQNILLLRPGLTIGDEAAFAVERGALGPDALLLWNEDNDRFELGLFDTVGGTVAPMATLATYTDLRAASFVAGAANTLTLTGSTLYGSTAVNIDSGLGSQLSLGLSFASFVAIGKSGSTTNFSSGSTVNFLNASIVFGAGGPIQQAGTATPEAAITADVGSVFMRTDGGAGTSLYIKETGVGNTGWVAVGAGGGETLAQTLALGADANGVTITGLNDLTGNDNTQVDVTGGASDGAGNAGSLTLTGGAASGAFSAGAVQLKGGAGHAGGGNPGNVVITAGASGVAAADTGAQASMTGGAGDGASTGGAGKLFGGAGGFTGNGGAAQLTSGAAGGGGSGVSGITTVSTGLASGVGGTSGQLNIFTGNVGAGTGDSGLITIDTGTSAGGTTGTVSLGASNASAVTISNAGSTTTFGDKIEFVSGGPTQQAGSATPEAAITADVGSVFMRTDGGTGTSLYIKETGVGNTGWVAVAAGGGGGGETLAQTLAIGALTNSVAIQASPSSTLDLNNASGNLCMRIGTAADWQILDDANSAFVRLQVNVGAGWVFGKSADGVAHLSSDDTNVTLSNGRFISAGLRSNSATYQILDNSGIVRISVLSGGIMNLHDFTQARRIGISDSAVSFYTGLVGLESLDGRWSEAASRFEATGGFGFGIGAGVVQLSGTGTPEAAVTAAVGSTFQRSNGATGTSLYIKETGAGNTGWVAVAAGGGGVADLQGAYDGGATIAGSTALDIDLTAAITIDSTGPISIGGDADAAAINIGTGAAARTVTIGNATGASGVVVNAGTGNIDIGANSAARKTRIATGLNSSVQLVEIGAHWGPSEVVLRTGSGIMDLVAGGELRLQAETAGLSMNIQGDSTWDLFGLTIDHVGPFRGGDTADAGDGVTWTAGPGDWTSGGVAAGIGGHFSFTGGLGGDTSTGADGGKGGLFTITAGAGGTGAATNTGGAGGDVTINAGAGGAGGGGSAGADGVVNLGTANTLSVTIGAPVVGADELDLRGFSGGAGGTVTVQGGSSSTAATVGGGVNVYGNGGGSGAAGGVVNVQGGGGGISNSAGGAVNVLGGSGGDDDGAGGATSVDGGSPAGSGTGGVLSLGATNASAVTISNAGATTTLGDKLEFVAGGPTQQAGAGAPEAAITADVGSIFMRTDGGTGTSAYIKESGVGNTGWVAVGTAAATTWVAYTPTGSWTTNATYSGYYMVTETNTGDMMDLTVKVVMGGLPTPAVTLTVTMPLIYEVDTTRAITTANGYVALTQVGKYVHAGTAGLSATVITPAFFDVSLVSATNGVSTNNIMPTVPYTLDNTAVVQISLRIPVVDAI